MIQTNIQEHPTSPECRICHGQTTRDLISSPCLCKGTLGCVHVTCLEQWINISQHHSCELCSNQFKVIKVRKYPRFASVFVWICTEKVFFSKTSCFLFLSTINSLLLCWLWLMWVVNIPDTFFKHKESKAEEIDVAVDEDDTSKTKWIIVFVFLTFLATFSLNTLFRDGYNAYRSLYNWWVQWRNETVEVKLLIDLQNYKVETKLEELGEENPLDEVVISISEENSTTDQNHQTCVE